MVVPAPARGRRVPASMIVVAVVLGAGFVAIVTAMVLSVTGEATPPPADLGDLPLPRAVQVVESHNTCKSEACDGQGAVLRWDPIIAGAAIDMLAAHLTAEQWVETDPCYPDARCFAHDDLRAVVRPWATLDPGIGSVMRVAIGERGLDDSEFVYARVYRCGIIEEC
jgi:hypothetical protein